LSTDLPVADRAAPLPPQLAWFAPWQAWRAMPGWKRYPLAAIGLLIAYTAVPVPLLYLLRSSGALRIPLVLAACQTVFAPLEFCYNHFQAVAWFYDTQREVLEGLLGTRP
jgi:hypothetical protein